MNKRASPPPREAVSEGSETTTAAEADTAAADPAPAPPPAPLPTVWNDEYTGVGGSYIVVDGKRQPAP